MSNMGNFLFLFEGRTVLWKGHECVVMERISQDRVKVCYKNNPRTVRIVKVEDVQKKPGRWG